MKLWWRMQIGKGNQMMWIRGGLIGVIGLSAGFIIAAGIYSFIAMVGVLTRLATRTNTAARVMLYEDMVTLGAAVGNCLYLWSVSLPFSKVILAGVGICTGIFIGCLAIALAEVLNVIPTFARRIHLKKGLAVILCFMGAGKLFGTLFQMVWMGKK